MRDDEYDVLPGAWTNLTCPAVVAMAMEMAMAAEQRPEVQAWRKRLERWLETARPRC